MSAIQIVITLLKADAGVTAVVPAANILPIRAQGTLPPPYILLNIVSGTGDQHLAGAGRYYESRVSLTIIAKTATEVVNTIANPVISALNDVVKATVGAATDVDIWMADSDITDESDDQSVCRRILDFYVRFKI